MEFFGDIDEIIAPVIGRIIGSHLFFFAAAGGFEIFQIFIDFAVLGHGLFVISAFFFGAAASGFEIFQILAFAAFAAIFAFTALFAFRFGKFFRHFLGVFFGSVFLFAFFFRGCFFVFLLLFLFSRFLLVRAVVIAGANRRRQGIQGIGERFANFRALEHARLGRRGISAGDGRALIGQVEDLNAAGVGNHHLANEAVGFLHQHYSEIGRAIGVFAEIDTHLRAANTDGGDRRFQGHRIGIDLGHLARNEGKYALQHRHGNAAFLGARIVNHFVQNHAPVFGHGKCRFIGEDDADGAFFARLQHIALEHRIAGFQLDPVAIGANRNDGAGDAFNLTDGLVIGSRRGLRHFLGRRENPRQMGRRIARQFGAARSFQHRRRFLIEIAFDNDLGTIRRGDHQVRSRLAELGIAEVDAGGQHDRAIGANLYGGALAGGAVAVRQGQVFVVAGKFVSHFGNPSSICAGASCHVFVIAAPRPSHRYR